MNYDNGGLILLLLAMFAFFVLIIVGVGCAQREIEYKVASFGQAILEKLKELEKKIDELKK